MRSNAHVPQMHSPESVCLIVVSRRPPAVIFGGAVAPIDGEAIAARRRSRSPVKSVVSPLLANDVVRSTAARSRGPSRSTTVRAIARAAGIAATGMVLSNTMRTRRPSSRESRDTPTVRGPFVRPGIPAAAGISRGPRCGSDARSSRTSTAKNADTARSWPSSNTRKSP